MTRSWLGLAVCLAQHLRRTRQLSELELLERCGNESEVCLSQPRIVAHAGDLRAASALHEVTIVLNHWQRPAENLAKQLRAAAAGQAKEVWVCLFGSPYIDAYEAAIESVRSGDIESISSIKVIRSEVDFGVYGRFLLASQAQTRYVYIIDDDVAFPVTAVSQYLRHFASRPGVWGHAGHIRHVNPEKARWIDRPRKPTAVDYANAAWFLETSWIAGAFLREPPLSRLTGEDMHLSHMVKKVLGLDTWVVGWRRDGHSLSRYQLAMTEMTTLTPSIFSFRSFMARAQSSRGPVMRQPPPLDAVVYVDTADQATAIKNALHLCSAGDTRSEEQLCSARSQSLSQRGTFRAALFFSGLQQPAERLMIENVGRAICSEPLSMPSCMYTPHELCGSVCEEMRFARVTSFDLQVGRGLESREMATRAYLAADALEAAAGLLSALRAAYLILAPGDTLVRRMVLQAAALRAEETSSDRRPLRIVELHRLDGSSATERSLPL